MRRLGVKLTAFDLLYWVNTQTVGNDVFEQKIVRNTLINLMDLYDHYCSDESLCVVCTRPENIFVTNRIGDIINHPEAVEASDRKYNELVSRFARAGLDLNMLYSAFISPESHTVVRAVAHQGIINDFGDMEYSRRSSMAIIGSNQPIVLQAEGFGKTGYDDTITLTFFIDSDSDRGTDNQSASATNELVAFTRSALGSTKVGDIELPTKVERLETEVLAIGGIRDSEREAVTVERHKVINAAKSHPVLGRLATGDDVWQIVSEGAGRTINEAMRVILDSKGDPSLTTDEAITLASIVFSKRGVQQSV